MALNYFLIMPFKDKQKQSEYNKKYKQTHKVEISKQRRIFKKKYPWIRSLESAKQRCTNIKNNHYKWYGAKGIKCFLTVEETEILFKRDKGYLMIKPTIDRKNVKGHYTFDNCQFIEHKLNSGKDK